MRWGGTTNCFWSYAPHARRHQTELALWLTCCSRPPRSNTATAGRGRDGCACVEITGAFISKADGPMPLDDGWPATVTKGPLKCAFDWFPWDCWGSVGCDWCFLNVFPGQSRLIGAIVSSMLSSSSHCCEVVEVSTLCCVTNETHTHTHLNNACSCRELLTGRWWVWTRVVRKQTRYFMPDEMDFSWI